MSRSSKSDIESTSIFITGHEVVEIGSYHALKTRLSEGKYRLFAEATCDPDRIDLQINAFYSEILSALPPGGMLRFMLINWVDPVPRDRFLKQYRESIRQASGQSAMGLLASAFERHLLEYPLPFIQRNIIEFAFNGRQEELTWWDALPLNAEKYGVRLVYLKANDLIQISKALFFPDYHFSDT